MSDAAAQPIADLSALDMQPERDAAPKEDRRFYVGLALALGLHSMLVAGFYGAPPRHIGDPSGNPDAISVALISEADLRGLSAVPDSAPKGQPAPQPAAPAASEPSPPPSPSAPAPQPSQPAPSQQAAVPDSALTLKPLPETLEKEVKPEQTPAPAPQAQPEPPAQPAKRERSRLARLDLSPPVTFPAPFAGGGAGLQRPPGITRSGENDAFARGVVSALQRTMPQLSDTRGRVTVRITLDMDGSLVSTQVVNPSRIAGLDRNVVFATRQTSFPFPPRNAKAADLVFLITYIYQ